MIPQRLIEHNKTLAKLGRPFLHGGWAAVLQLAISPIAALAVAPVNVIGATTGPSQPAVAVQVGIVRLTRLQRRDDVLGLSGRPQGWPQRRDGAGIGSAVGRMGGAVRIVGGTARQAGATLDNSSD